MATSPIITAIADKISVILKDSDFHITPEELNEYIEKPADQSLGDLALPCFKLSRALRLPPPKIAADLQDKLQKESLPHITKVEAAGGYLNFFISEDYYLSLLRGIAANPDYGSSDVGNGKTICLDFSSPNIAKRFHLGHLGTTVIGNSLRNIFNFCGYKTVGINHLGDWGTQFGKLIVAYENWSSREKVDEGGINELVDIYVRFSDEEQKDPTLTDKAREAFSQLEAGNQDYLDIWQYFKDISLKEYQKTYDLLGITFDSFHGEAFYSDKMPAVVEELREKRLLIKDQGATIVDLQEHKLPNVLILKSDGSTLYPTRDIAAAFWRKKEYDFEKCLYVTSAGQSLHFAQWFKVIELMGYDWAQGLVHVPYGTMSIGGEKLASRTGNVVLLEDLLTQAIAKSETIITEKNSDLKDKKSVAKAVGVGAVVFNALANSRIKDTDFDWDKALSFEGNTGPYVQYTYARSASVLRKAGSQPTEWDSAIEPNNEESDLLKRLIEFPETVLRAMEEYEPSVISRYMLSICTSYNQFYHNCPILKSEGATRAFRLTLTKAFWQILGNALDLIGMERTEEI